MDDIEALKETIKQKESELEELRAQFKEYSLYESFHK